MIKYFFCLALCITLVACHQTIYMPKSVATPQRTESSTAQKDEEENEADEDFICEPISTKDFNVKNNFFGTETKVVVSVYTQQYTKDRFLNRSDKNLQNIQTSYQMTLNEEQKLTLFDLLYGRQGGDNNTACYEPRHLIEFYKQEKRIAFIEICFECNRDYTQGLPIANLCNASNKDIKIFFNKIGLPTTKH